MLALACLETQGWSLPAWSDKEAGTLRGEAARQLSRSADAAVMLGPASARLVAGINLVPFLEAGGPFGPAWTAHPFASPAITAGYKLREPDVTGQLASFMNPASSGRRAAQRAVSFLRVLTEQAGANALRDTLTHDTRPVVSPEHVVHSARRRASLAAGAQPTRTRIDLLFEWPLGIDGRQAVVVVEAKLGAVVSDQQLLSYREEAKRRAKGGPVALVLLTASADAAERRYPAWKPVRWFKLLRRWEAELAQAGDDDAEFARLRAHVWRFLLANPRAFR